MPAPLPGPPARAETGHMPPVGEADVAAGLAEVREGVARAARDSDRDPADVHLIAISKTVPAEGILPALEAGQRLFGENYVQESAAKWPALKERFRTWSCTSSGRCNRTRRARRWPCST